MTWLSPVADWLLANAVAATALALLAVALEPVARRRPALAHGLWLVVLARLLIAPIWTPEVHLGAAPEAWAPGGLSFALPEPLATPITAEGAAPTLGPTTVALILWLVISASILVVVGVSIRRLQRRSASSRPAGPELAARWRALAGRLDMTTPPPLGFVDGRCSPMLVSIAGWSRVLVPTRLWDDLSEAERDALLLHELAHFKRHDHWVRHLELVAIAIFWWHPVAWWASRRLRRFEELDCDRLVTETAPEHRRAYADGLVKTLRYLGRHHGSPRALACGVRAVDNLKGRLDMIFQSDRPATLPPTARVAMAALALTALMVSPAVTSEPSPAAEETFAGQPLDLSVENVPLHQVLDSIAETSGLNMVIVPDVDHDRAVTAQLDGVPWDQALDGIVRVTGLDYTVENDLLWIHPPGLHCDQDEPFDGMPIDLRLKRADLREVLVDFERYSGLDIALEDGIEGTVELTLLGIPWDQALDTVLRLNRLSATVEGGALMVRRAAVDDDC